jgi:hypothetical protein
MKQIRITRSGGTVNFETVAVNETETVFFLNLDAEAAHFPTLINNQLGKAPSAPSSQCDPNPDNLPLPATVTYRCRINGHGQESGTIKVFAQLAAANTTLQPATVNQPIPRQQVVQGGMSPYTISNRLFEIRNSTGVIQSGSGIGPGLTLTPSTDNSGVFVSGTPTVAGTYNFTFEVDDGMGDNLQQVQYSMRVS